MQCIIMEKNTLIKLLHHDETKKRAHDSGFSPPVNIFTDHSKAVLLLWIICVIYVLCLSCFRVCSLLPCGQLLGKG